jgi:hypothetical protein
MKPSIVALLLEKGANPNIKCFPKSVFEIDNEGVTPAELVQEPPYVYNTPAITKMVVEASNQFPEDQDTKEQGISEGVRKLHDDDKPNDESLSYEQMLAGSRGTAIEKVMVEFNKLYEQEKYPEALKTVIPILSGNNIDYDSQLLSDDDRLKIRITKFKA